MNRRWSFFSLAVALAIAVAAPGAQRGAAQPAHDTKGKTPGHVDPGHKDPGHKDPGHGGGPHKGQMHPSQVAALRGATARFQRLENALAEGYTAFGDCFSDPVLGGMGYHYVNDALVADPEIDPLRPELLVYERQRNGRLRLVAVEYITFVSAWHAQGHHKPPSLFGQEFHINPTLLEEPFYLLHAWVWKRNPAGILADWNPNVRCP